MTHQPKKRGRPTGYRAPIETITKTVCLTLTSQEWADFLAQGKTASRAVKSLISKARSE